MDFPGEKLIIRLWETLAEKGIGSLLKPGQIRREGLARIDVRRAELLALAETERDVQLIRTGQRSLQEYMPSAQFASRLPSVEGDASRVEPTIDIKSVLEVAAQTTLEDAARREVNVAKAIIQAEHVLIEDKQEPPEEKVNDDWIHRWRNFAGEVSSEFMQELWGRALAGEIKAPGKYSLRCLDFLRNLSQNEAKSIEKLYQYVIAGRLFKDRNEILNRAGITFGFLLQMEELGILSGVESIGLSVTWESLERDHFKQLLLGENKVLIVKHEEQDKVLSLEAQALVTTLGMQLFSLGNFKTNTDYIENLGNLISGEGFEVILADYINTGEGQINYFNGKVLK